MYQLPYISPDSKLLATTFEDSILRLWDIAIDAFVQTLDGYGLRHFRVAFSPDSQSLASTTITGGITKDSEFSYRGLHSKPQVPLGRHNHLPAGRPFIGFGIGGICHSALGSGYQGP